MPTWLCISGYLALSEWLYHRGYLGFEDLFLYSSSVYSCYLFLISSASVRPIPFLSFIEPIFAWNVPLVSLIFLRSLVFPFYCFPLLLCTDHWGRLSYLSLLFFGTLHSNGCIFRFLLCFSLLFFSQLFGLLSHFAFIIWRRQWHPTPVLLPGKSHERRSLVGCSPWGREESDTTERLQFHFSLSCIGEGNGNPLQCSCLENPRDGGVWWAAVYGIAQSRMWLKWLSSKEIEIWNEDYVDGKNGPLK